jgi:hypothetical protein
MGERKGSYRFLVGKPEARSATGRASHGWEDNIKMDLNEIVWEGRHWVDLHQNRDKWQKKNSGSTECREFEWLSNCQLSKNKSALWKQLLRARR